MRVYQPGLMVSGFGGPCFLNLKGRQSFGRLPKKAAPASRPDLTIPAPAISRRHGEFITDEAGTRYRDVGSANGTIYNGRMLKPFEVVGLKDGDVLRIHIRNETGGRLDTVLVYSAGVVEETVRNIQEGRVLSIRIRERAVSGLSGKKVLLDNISMDIREGQMVLILGGSGAGKTTFMNAVMGYEKADADISYNGKDVYRDFDEMKYEIGYVPQQDLMRMDDVVYDTLMNSAQMRLPADRMNREDYKRRVDETLGMFGLGPEADNLVGKLSGGQRKRLSIAVEYIGNPSLFFLDEPDSGLDGAMARELMENLRGIADQGKIVLVISHAPDRVKDLFDRVIVLAKGSDNAGHLAFFGTPDRACGFFGTPGLEQIVRRINRADEGGDGMADEFIEKWMAGGER